MPYRRRRRRFSRRRPRRRMSRRRRSRFTVAVARPIVTDKTITSLTYCDTFTSSGTAPYTYVYSHNSCYDPDVTGVGHQPRGYDEWVRFYGRYHVHACKAEIFVTNQSAYSIICVLVPSAQNTSALATPEHGAELPYSKVMTVQSLQNDKKLSQYITTDRMVGFRTANDRDFIPQVTANPVVRTYWKIGLQTQPALSAISVHVLVKLTYYVSFDERILLGLS